MQGIRRTTGPNPHVARRVDPHAFGAASVEDKVVLRLTRQDACGKVVRSVTKKKTHGASAVALDLDVFVASTLDSELRVRVERVTAVGPDKDVLASGDLNPIREVRRTSASSVSDGVSLDRGH